MKPNAPSARHIQSLASGNHWNGAYLLANSKWNFLSPYRYRCLKCTNVDLCQNCYWTQQTLKNHKITHPTREYCLAVSSYDTKNSSEIEGLVILVICLTRFIVCYFFRRLQQVMIFVILQSSWRTSSLGNIDVIHQRRATMTTQSLREDLKMSEYKLLVAL